MMIGFNDGFSLSSSWIFFFCEGSVEFFCFSLRRLDGHWVFRSCWGTGLGIVLMDDGILSPGFRERERRDYGFLSGN